MVSVSSLSSPLVAVLALFVMATLSIGAPDHFILTRVSTLTFARLDPIVNPGKVSGHLHNIMGASCFSQDLSTPEQLQDCDCSSTIIGADKSNYWAPTLFYQYPNNTVGQILTGARIYYFTEGKDVKPFPPGFRMISGMAMSRNASDPKTLGVAISCDHGLQTQWLPNGTSHPGGCEAIQMGIYFPSCGLASGDLDSPDHFSHMAWPQARPGGGAEPFDDPNNVYCPESHPIKYPTIFMEATYYLTGEQKWHSGNPLILSQGDESGLTYHADFHNGWDQKVLKDTLEQCGEGNGPGDQLADCAPLAKSMNETATWYCRYQNKIPNEDVGLYRPLDKLPGCNTRWPVDGPNDKPECVESDLPALIYPNAMFTNLQYRERVPILFTEAKNLSDPWEMDDYIPGLGGPGSSSIKPWGTYASNPESLRVSTVAEINAANGGEDNVEPAVSSAAHSSAAAASASASPAQLSGVAVALAPPSKAASASGGAPTTTTMVCNMKKKKRGLVERAKDIGGDLKAHMGRRSRRGNGRH